MYRSGSRVAWMRCSPTPQFVKTVAASHKFVFLFAHNSRLAGCVCVCVVSICMLWRKNTFMKIQNQERRASYRATLMFIEMCHKEFLYVNVPKTSTQNLYAAQVLSRGIPAPQM